ncbi:MAG TPA: UDP-N-acetylglucosamine--N-acetylmuramyl-(pentapeptide) pyrophosphoryl-undecaprenol N-acetylglucosamine transferase [Gemmatimonadaceae bacterium]|nr:UDP-N-acetylglucosamine--N-acetylmuramyl-(pentapeptide) pyrophosphoryl-undecaprenol N-acetylglucosamine transferase [Gemmatimonadaceae bacterium]
MRILFAGGGTGGHLYPGLAIARALVALEPGATPYFIGARRGVERDILPQSIFPHLLLDLHPLYRLQPWRNWRTAWGLMGSWKELDRLVARERPAALVATGGYASGAALAFARKRRIPIVLQEQNSYPGLTTRLASRAAREIYLGYGEAAQHLSPRAGAWVGVTGNPIEPPPAERPPRAMARAHWKFADDDAPVLLIFGGSQGALALNQAVSDWMDSGMPKSLYVIWATGSASHAAFARHAGPRVRVVSYLSPIADAYAAADFALTRAGALTAAELCAWGIPSVLVPLPTAAADHQTANARALAVAGAAVMLEQRDLSVERLDAELRALMVDEHRRSSLASAALERGRPDAAREIASRILRLIASDASH